MSGGPLVRPASLFRRRDGDEGSLRLATGFPRLSACRLRGRLSAGVGGAECSRRRLPTAVPPDRAGPGTHGISMTPPPAIPCKRPLLQTCSKSRSIFCRPKSSRRRTEREGGGGYPIAWPRRQCIQAAGAWVKMIPRCVGPGPSTVLTGMLRAALKFEIKIRNPRMP